MNQPHTLSPADLRRYIASHSERDYLLIDVREPAEYHLGHLPGARLIPLLDLDTHAARLPAAPRKILYCHSGIRSSRAAVFLSLTHGLPNVSHLGGGIQAWRGTTLQALPRTELFATAGTPAQLLLQAMDLEKGARRFYLALHHEFAVPIVRSATNVLAEAELHHGRRLYGLLAEVAQSGPPPFDILFGGLLGNVTESGATFSTLIREAGRAGPSGAATLLELAVEMEYRALDLYRSLCYQIELPALRDGFLDLADGEKIHIRILLRALNDLAAAQAAER